MMDTGQKRIRHSRRRAVRRAVSVECEVLCDQWDGSVYLTATNLSDLGIWVETPLALEVGEEVIVVFKPPFLRIPMPMVALASVARVGMFRRRIDSFKSGMGLVFSELEPNQKFALAQSLCGMPPPLPKRPQYPRDNIGGQPGSGYHSRHIDEAVTFPVRFTAEGSLLTGSSSIHRTVLPISSVSSSFCLSKDRRADPNSLNIAA